MELSDAEATISTLNKKLSALKEQQTKNVANLNQIRTDKLLEAHNIELQIVLKTGLVEVPTTGRISDFQEAVLVSRDDVAEINKIILVIPSSYFKKEFEFKKKNLHFTL